MVHPFMAKANIKNKAQFYQKYPTQEDYFKEHPEDASKAKEGGQGYSGTFDMSTGSYYLKGGQVDVKQNQALPNDKSVPNSLRNVKEMYKNNAGGYPHPFTIQSSGYNDVPTTLKSGGYADKFYPGQMCAECGGMYQSGGFFPDNKPVDYNEIARQKYISDSTDYSNQLAKDPKMAQWLYNQYNNIAKSNNTTAPNAQNTINAYDSAIKAKKGKGGYEDGGWHDEFKSGGWIKSAIKHPGRCTKGSPNYDCPKGSPQWNLAQRFRHGDLHKKQAGGDVQPSAFDPNQNNSLTNPNFNLSYKDSEAQFSQDPVAQQQIMGATKSDLPGVTGNDPIAQNAVNMNTMQPGTQGQHMNSGNMKRGKPVAGYYNNAMGVLGAAMLTGEYFNGLRQQRYNQGSIRDNGMTSSLYNGQSNPYGSKGDYVNQGSGYGNFRPQQQVIANPVTAYSKMGGKYEAGGSYDLPISEIRRLQKGGYVIEFID